MARKGEEEEGQRWDESHKKYELGRRRKAEEAQDVFWQETKTCRPGRKNMNKIIPLTFKDSRVLNKKNDTIIRLVFVCLR